MNTADMLNKILANAKQSVKTASEPETSHPTGKADPNNMAPTEGAHGKAITATVKSDNPQGPENGSAPSNDGQGKPGAPINAKRTETDEGVPTTTSTQVDPGTSHPAEAGKTASLRQQTADLVAAIHGLVKAAATQGTPATPAAPESTKEAAAAGTAVADEALVAAEKAAAEEAEITKLANALYAQAGRDAETLEAFILGMQKSAADESGMAAGPVTEGAPPAEAMAPEGGMPPEGGTPPEGGGGMEAEIQQMIEALLAAGVTEEEIQAILQEGGPEALMQMFEQLQGAAAEAPAEEAKVAALTRATMVKAAEQKILRAVEAVKNSRKR